jgi:Zn-dependent protease
LLLTYSDLLGIDFRLFLTFAGSVMVALVLGIAFHEFSHAWTAYVLGDPTAKLQGRVTLNPVAHLDPTGTAFLLIGGFGWGKPTPVNPFRLRNGPRTGRAIVAGAGPVSNIIMATLAAIPLRIGLVDWRSPFLVPRSVSNWDLNDYLSLFLTAIIIFNIFLAVFNLLPLAPLDGFAVALGLLPHDMAREVAKFEQYGPAILMALILLPFVTQGQISILHQIMSPVINGLTEVIAGGGRAIG